METLAIVAYRQPLTRPEVDDIRGVDCGPVLKTLLDRGLVRVLGKREELGRPLLYGTTPDFLKTFSLKDLSDLPTLREFHELGEEEAAQVAEAHGEAPIAEEPLPTASPIEDPEVTAQKAAEEAALIGELDDATRAASKAVRHAAAGQKTEQETKREPEQETKQEPEQKGQEEAQAETPQGSHQKNQQAERHKTSIKTSEATSSEVPQTGSDGVKPASVSVEAVADAQMDKQSQPLATSGVGSHEKPSERNVASEVVSNQGVGGEGSSSDRSSGIPDGDIGAPSNDDATPELPQD